MITDHIYVGSTLVSHTYEKEIDKGKSKITVAFKAWQVKAESIRKLNRTKKRVEISAVARPAGLLTLL